MNDYRLLSGGNDMNEVDKKVQSLSHNLILFQTKRQTFITDDVKKVNRLKCLYLQKHQVN